MNNKLLLLLLTTSFIFGCYNTQDEKAKLKNLSHIDRFLIERVKPNYKAEVVDGDLEPKEFPDLVKDKETLLGIDSDNDGVRDDLEIYINRQLKFDYERWIAKKQVRAARTFILNADKVTTSEARRLEDLTKDQACEMYIFGRLEKQSSHHIKYDYYFSGFMFFNTKLRNTYKNKYLKQEKEDDTPLLKLSMEESCPPEVLEKYIKPDIKKNENLNRGKNEKSIYF